VLPLLVMNKIIASRRIALSYSVLLLVCAELFDIVVVCRRFIISKLRSQDRSFSNIEFLLRDMND